eukprot:SAG31_NODE_15887_length_733_cov_1.410095_1_plen_202_part_00
MQRTNRESINHVVLANCALFTAEETAAGVKDGEKTEVRASFAGGHVRFSSALIRRRGEAELFRHCPAKERKQFWTLFEQLKSEVQRTSRKWKRAAARVEGSVASSQTSSSAPSHQSSATKPDLSAELAAEMAKAKAAAEAAASEPIDLATFDSAEQLLFKGPGPAALKAVLAVLKPPAHLTHSTSPHFQHSDVRKHHKQLS